LVGSHRSDAVRTSPSAEVRGDDWGHADALGPTSSEVGQFRAGVVAAMQARTVSVLKERDSPASARKTAAGNGRGSVARHGRRLTAAGRKRLSELMKKRWPRGDVRPNLLSRSAHRGAWPIAITAVGREGRFQNDEIACVMPELGMLMARLPRANNYDRKSSPEWGVWSARVV
jgi:hypothetical protein